MKYIGSKLKTAIWSAFVLLFFAAFISGCGTDEAAPVYISTRAELTKALAEKQAEIYVDDIAFDEADIYVEIAHSVAIIGRPQQSTLTKAHFVVTGGESESGLINVSFRNLIFDGCYEMPDGDPQKAESFGDFHGDREDKAALTANGFLELSLENCIVTRYCRQLYPALYVNYAAEGIGKASSCSIRGCTFSKNISERGALWINANGASLELRDTVVEKNLLHTNALIIGGVNAEISGLQVLNNERVVYGEKSIFTHSGGGLALSKSDAVMSGCRIEGNTAINGGGMSVSGCSLLLSDSVIRNNHALEYGGGMIIGSSESGPVYVTNCIFEGNSADELEGAIMVWPADQINIGKPTGTVEFSFCTFSGNSSPDGEHLKYHPIATEDPATSIGRDGRVDFIACRIQDDAVDPALVNGENCNVVNDSRMGDAVPEAVAGRVALGRYSDVKQTLYAGENTIKGDRGMDGKALGWVLSGGGVCILLTASLFIRKAGQKPVEPETAEGEAGDAQGSVDAPEADLLEFPMDEMISEMVDQARRLDVLTDRELDILREYLKGKKRQKIAEELFISESTVKNHISKIFSKLEVKSKEELEGKLMGQ